MCVCWIYWIFKYMLATSNARQNQGEDGSIIFLLLHSNFVRGIATVLEKKCLTIALPDSQNPSNFYPFFPPSFVLNGALLSHPRPTPFPMPGTFLPPSFLDLQPCFFSFIFSDFNICLSIRSFSLCLNRFQLFSL